VKRVSYEPLLLLASLFTNACDGREISVFELPDLGGAGGAASFAGASVGTDGSEAGANAQGAGSSSGGTLAASAGTAPGSGGTPDQLSAAGDSGSGTPGCRSDADCMGWSCEMQGCQATTGVCVPWPAVCEADPAPVCGCDGVTYWNDCIRQQSHARLSVPQPCRATATACEVGADCPVPYASCSHLQPPAQAPGGMCGRGMGACWVLPLACAPSPDPRMWRDCKPPDAGPPGPCVDTCTAIASEHSFAELHRGDPCN